MIESDLRTYLLGQAAISALVGARMYPVILPQDADLPAITYQRVGGGRVHSLDGYSGLSHPRFQIDCWASTYDGASSLSDLVVSALDSYPGAIADEPRDFYEPEVLISRRTIDVTIWHHA